MNALHRSLVAFVSASTISSGAFAAGCPGGSPSAEVCVRELKLLEAQLSVAYTVEEKRLVELYKEPGYGGLPGREYSAEVVKGFRATNAAWRVLRDRECWYLALRDGMNLSPDYASPVSEACKVGRTSDRIKAFKQ